MTIKKNILLISFFFLGFFSCIEKANALSFAEFVYNKARTGDIQTINRYLNRGYHIDSVDQSGNSALCIAISKKDIFAYKKIKAFGANTKHPCTKKFQKKQSTQKSTTPTKEKISTNSNNTGIYIASGLAVAGAAALAGGGGGGGSSSNKKQCPDGQILIDGECKLKPIVCDEGYTLVGNTCEPIICPEGQTLVGNSCEPIICPEGQTLVGNSCEPIICPEGQTLVGNSCEPIICPEGQTLVGNSCEPIICPEGQTLVGNSCEPIICPEGQTLVGNSCEPIVCPEGYTLVGNTCEPGPNNCEEGYVPAEDGSCQPRDCGPNFLSTCDEGQYKTGNTCLSGEILLKECLNHTQISDCVAYSSTSDTCIECREDYLLQYNRCVKIIECPEGFIQANNSCVAVENINKENNADEDLYGIYSTEHNAFNLYSVYAHPDDYQEINLTNTGNGKTIGIYSEHHVSNALVDGRRLENEINPIQEGTGVINITHHKNGDVYGIYSKIIDAQNSWEAINSEAADGAIAHGQINITNYGTGKTYGIFGDDRAYNAFSMTRGYSYGDINIEANGEIYGIGGYMAAMNATSHQTYLGSKSIGNINITSNGDGNVYGIHIQKDTKELDKDVAQWFAINAASGGDDYVEGNINIRNYGSGNVYGMYGGQQLWNAIYYGMGNISGIAKGNINILNTGSGDVYGMYMPEEDVNGKVLNISEAGIIHETLGETSIESTINLVNTGDGITTGLRGGNFNLIENSGIININNLGSGTAIGIYGGTDAYIINSGEINIYRTTYTDEKTGITYTPSSEIGGTAYGIYAQTRAKVTNTGTITITNAADGKGIYLEEGATLENTGTITFNGEITPDATTGEDLNIYNTPTPTSVTNFDSMGKGEVILSTNGKFYGDTLKGNLSVSQSPLLGSFENTYTISDSINANDISELNLKSKSAMFNAEISATEDEKHDVTLTRKNFNELIKNKSIANFLEENYKENKNLSLYDNLKTASTASDLSKKTNALTGNNVIPSFRKENSIVFQNLNRQFSDILFNEPNNNYVAGYKFINISNDSDKSLEESKGKAHSAYGLLKDKTSSGITYGLGATISQLNTDYDDNSKRKSNQFGLWLPLGYDFNNGIKWYSKLHAGYNDNSYDRKSLNGEKSADYNEYQFGLANEIRYTLDLANSLKIEPLLELNLLNFYQDDISEKSSENSLNIKSNNATSLELGLGSHITKEFNFENNKTLKLKIGGIYYVEFLEPDKALKGSINTMNKNFDIIRKQSNNRGVISLNASYNINDITLYGNIEKEFGTTNGFVIDAGMQYKF